MFYHTFMTPIIMGAKATTPAQVNGETFVNNQLDAQFFFTYVYEVQSRSNA